MLAQFKVVKIVDVSVMPTGMLLGRFNLPGNSPESEIQIERKMYWSLGSNVMEPGLQYIGAHQIFVLQNRLVGQKYSFVSVKPLISDISNDEEDSNVNKSFMNNSSDTESSHSSDFGDLLKPKKRRTHK